MASITKRFGSWQTRISYKKRNGKYATFSKAGFKTKKAAQLYSNSIEDNIALGILPNDKKNSHVFAEYFNSWFEDFKKAKISERTQHRYIITYHELQNYFNQTEIENITRRKYQQFINAYGANHAKDTVKKVNSLIRACVHNAIYEDMITKDFTENVELVFNPKKSRKIEYLNMQEIQQLSAYSLNHINKNFTSHQMILTAIYTGMRLGEIQGLQWKDINTDFKTITVRHALNESTQELIPTKNEASNRIIRINQDLTDMFIEMKQHKRADLIFINQYGTVPTSAAVNKTLRESLKSLNIKRAGFHFHSLRHTHVAYLLYCGADLYAISKRLGHSDLATTTRVYSYLIEEYKVKTDNKIEQYLDDITAPKSVKEIAE